MILYNISRISLRQRQYQSICPIKFLMGAKFLVGNMFINGKKNIKEHAHTVLNQHIYLYAQNVK